MAMENKRITQLSTERLNLTSGDYVMVDDADNGSAKYRLDRLKETDSTLSVSGKAADAAATGQAISDEAEARENADNALGNDISDLLSAISYSPYANNEVRNGSVGNPDNAHYVCMRRIMPTAGAAYILLKPIIPFAIPDGCTLSYSVAEYPESLIGEYSSGKNDQRIFILDGSRSASADHSYIYPVATKGNSGFAYGVAIISKSEETVPRDLRVSDGVVLAYDLIPAEATVNSVVYLSNNGKWHVSSVNSNGVPTVHFDDAINIIPERGRYVSTFNYSTALAMLGQDYVTKGDGNAFYIAFGEENSNNALVYDRKNRRLALINRNVANEDINMLLLLRAHYGGVDGGALNVPSEMKIYPSVKNDVVNEIKNKIEGVTIANGSIGNPQNAYSIRQQVVLDTHGAPQISFWLIGELPDGYHVQASIAQYPESDIGLNIDGKNDHRTGVNFEYRNVSSPDGRVCTIELNPKYHGVSFSMCVTSDADASVHYPVSIATHSMNYKLEYLPAKFFTYVGDNGSCDIVSISNGIIQVHCHNFLHQF